MKGDVGSMRNLLITFAMQNLYYLGPLNLFLYTWRFLKELRISETNSIVKVIYQISEIVTIAVLPFTFYFCMSEWIKFSAKQVYYLAKLQLKNA